MNRHDGRRIVSLAFSVGLAFICKHSRWRTREMTRDCCFCYCFLFSCDEEGVCNQKPRKEKVVGTWSIFKKEKSRRIWEPCERTSCVRQRALLSVCCQFCILVFKVIASVLQTCSTSQMHGITYHTHLYIAFYEEWRCHFFYRTLFPVERFKITANIF